MPRELIGGVAKLKRNGVLSNICFDYNLGKCKAAKPGEACPRGVHVCCMPGCHEKHPKVAKH